MPPPKLYRTSNHSLATFLNLNHFPVVTAEPHPVKGVVLVFEQTRKLNDKVDEWYAALRQIRILAEESEMQAGNAQ